MTTTNSAHPPPRARHEIHTKVLAMIRGLGHAPGHAFDAPLGPGALARELLALGWQVSGVDIDLTTELPAGGPILGVHARMAERQTQAA